MGRAEDSPQPNKGDGHQQVVRKPIQRLERHVWGRMVAGFLVLIPLIVTVLIVRFVIGYMDGFIRPLFFVKDKPYDFPGIGLVVAVVVLYVIGALVSGKLGSLAVSWQSAVLGRIPIVRSIYGVSKQVADALSTPMDNRFSRVVFIEWPRPGMRAVGFVTGHWHSPENERALLVVYIPTVPNPTSGNLAFVTEDDVIETGMTVEEAMKVVFSGGIVLPDTLQVQLRRGLT